MRTSVQKTISGDDVWQVMVMMDVPAGSYALVATGEGRNLTDYANLECAIVLKGNNKAFVINKARILLGPNTSNVASIALTGVLEAAFAETTYVLQVRCRSNGYGTTVERFDLLATEVNDVTFSTY